jgi:hypothetical protein
MSHLKSTALRVEELESRENPVLIGLAPGFPAPLATSGPFDGVVTLFPPLFGTGQFNANPASVGTVVPFPGFNGTVRTAFSDVNGDAIQDLIDITGPGAPLRVAVISGQNFTSYLIPPFDPFGDNFTGGGFVAAGNIDLIGGAEIVVTPDRGGGPRVSVFSLSGFSPILRSNFFGIEDANFRGGARPAVGDFNADAFADVAIAAGPGGGPRIAIYNGRTFFLATTPPRLVNDFFAFPEPSSQNLRDGVYIATGDIDGDFFDDLVVGSGTGGAPRVIGISGRLLTQNGVEAAQANLVASFFAGDVNTRGGIRVAVKSVGIGSRDEIVTGSGVAQPSQVRAYFGLPIRGVEPTQFQVIDPYGVVLPDGVYVG